MIAALVVLPLALRVPTSLALRVPSLLHSSFHSAPQHCALPISNRRAVVTAAAACFLMTAPTSAAPQPFARMASEAASAFEKANYVECERLWRIATEAYPDQDIAWSNLAVALIINASDDPAMKLGVAPSGVAKQRLEEALTSISKAAELGSTDSLTLNAQGNALGLLLRWEEARAAYAASTAVATRDFESIPRSNEALTLLELRQPEASEKLARRLLRRDPNFVDAQALLATIKWSQRDAGGAAAEMSALCDRPRDGQTWCERYSTADVVLGRWPPLAVSTYRDMLKDRSIQLVFKNSRALPSR